MIEFAPIESAEEFRTFDEAGFAKTVYDLSASELAPSRTLLTGVMRTATTDEYARRWFRRYCTFGVGSGAHILVGALLDSARRGGAMSSRRFWAVGTARPTRSCASCCARRSTATEPPDSADRCDRPQERPGVHPPGRLRTARRQRAHLGRLPEHKRWWRNLTDAGAPVRMWLRGVERSGHAISGGDQRSGVTVDIAFDHPAASVRRSPTNSSPGGRAHIAAASA